MVHQVCPIFVALSHHINLSSRPLSSSDLSEAALSVTRRGGKLSLFYSCRSFVALMATEVARGTFKKTSTNISQLFFYESLTLI